MYENYEFQSDGSLKYPSNDKGFKPSIKERVKRYILKYNLLPRITKNTRYTIINWFGYEMVWRKY